MEYIMEKFDLNRYFDMVVTALPKDVKNPKPHPESVEKILNTQCGWGTGALCG